MKVWNPQTAEEPAALKLEERILSLAWLPAGDALALGSQRQSIRLWKTDGKAAPTELFKAPSEVTRMAWRKDGSVLAAGLKNNDVVLLEASSGKVLKTFAAKNQRSGAGGFVWLDDRRLLVTHRYDSSGSIYDTAVDQLTSMNVPVATHVHHVLRVGPTSLSLLFSTPTGIKFAEVGSRSAHASLAVDGILEPENYSLAWSAAVGNLILPLQDRIAVYRADLQSLLCSQVILDKDEYVFVSPEGHWRGSVGVEQRLVYLVEDEAGCQSTLRPAEFAARYGWNNDPIRVRMSP